MKNVYFFYGSECPNCMIMEKLVDRLLEEEGILIKKMECWHNTENENLMVSLDDSDECCGGVPFFYNENTGKSICGEVNYKELRIWAESK